MDGNHSGVDRRESTCRRRTGAGASAAARPTTPLSPQITAVQNASQTQQSTVQNAFAHGTAAVQTGFAEGVAAAERAWQAGATARKSAWMTELNALGVRQPALP